jgi:hypothetical protein
MPAKNVTLVICIEEGSTMYEEWQIRLVADRIYDEPATPSDTATLLPSKDDRRRVDREAARWLRLTIGSALISLGRWIRGTRSERISAVTERS